VSTEGDKAKQQGQEAHDRGLRAVSGDGFEHIKDQNLRLAAQHTAYVQALKDEVIDIQSIPAGEVDPRAAARRLDQISQELKREEGRASHYWNK
jgi:N-dimethylarginine dimethylaminohydrolase